MPDTDTPRGHFPRRAPFGLATEERDCPACGKRTIHFWYTHKADPQIGAPDESSWECTGLTAEEHAAEE